MAKESGLGMTCSVDDSGGTPRAIGNDIHNLNFGVPRGVQDVTGINSSAMERILLLADFSVQLSGTFNDDANMSHDVFKTVSSTAVTRTVSIAFSGNTLPNECLFSDYALTRNANGELTWQAPGQLNSTVVPTWA